MPGPNATAHTYAEMGSLKEFKARFDIKKINERDESGDSFLLRAIYGDKTDTALYLIKKGIDLNMTDSDGNTALHYAAWRKNKVGLSPLDMTIKIGYKEAENLLRKELNRRSD